MNSAIFTHIKSDGTQRGLVLDRSDVCLVFKEDAAFYIGLMIEGTEPGMTMDDRGAPDWDSPVRLEVGIAVPFNDGLTLETMVAKATAPAEYTEQFVYYWEHATITQLSARLTGAAGQRLDVDISANSAEGEVRFQGELPVDGVRLGVENAADKDAAAARAQAILGLDALPAWKDRGDFGWSIYLKLGEA